MWKPKSIKIVDLFAHRHSEYEFKQGTCTVIFGKNDTDRGMENNGAGKTTLFEAVCIALTGDSLRNIKKDNFINRDSKSCTIEMCLENSVLNKTLKIHRTYYKGNKSAKVEIYENGELNNQITSVQEANKRVFELIGVSREDLLRYYIIPQDNHYSFFTAGDVEKKDIMNRITSADMVTPVLERLKLDVKELESNRRNLESERSKLEGAIETIDEQREAWLSEPTNSDRIKELCGDIEALDEECGAIEEEIRENGLKVLKKEKELSEFILPDVSKVRNSKAKAEDEIEELDSEKDEYKRLQRDLNLAIDSKITCPKCKCDFFHNSDYDGTYEEAVADLSQLKEYLSEIEERRSKLVSKVSKAEDEISKSKEIQRSIDESQEAVNKLKRIGEHLKSDKLSKMDRIQSIKERIAQLEKEKEEDARMVELLKRRKVKEKELEAVISKIEKLDEELEMRNFWVLNLGKNGFMTYLANKSIKVIEGTTNKFLQRFKVDLRVEMSGFTVLKSGDVREKIDITVSNDGNTWESFMGKSGGERGRVSLAGVLAIQHLINSSLGGRGLDLLLFDECFSGLDSKGQENIIKIFENLGLTIMVITQNVSYGFANDNTLLVFKKDGVSKYVS